MAHKHEKELGRIEPGALVEVTRADLLNMQGQSLERAQLVVGAILVNGIWAGEARGSMFEPDGGGWKLAPKGKQWAAIEADSVPTAPELTIDTFHGEDPFFVLVLNKEATPITDVQATIRQGKRTIVRRVPRIDVGGMEKFDVQELTLKNTVTLTVSAKVEGAVRQSSQEIERVVKQREVVVCGVRVGGRSNHNPLNLVE